MTISPDCIVDVVHIAFQGYGDAPLDRFLTSYDRWPAGHPHALTIALKRHGAGAERDVVVDRSRRSGGAIVDVPDGGFDIGTYFHMAARSRADVLCLTNSNTEILGAAWLRKLVDALRDQGGGAVSATGSWQSVASDQLAVRYEKRVSPLRRIARMAKLLRRFPAFPNAHLRTNGLVIGREDLLRLGDVQPRTKEEAWRFESGRTGLSARLRRSGLPIRIVGRDGRAFSPEQWDRSDTFWQAEQDNLLISDNQTNRYATGEADLRASLSQYAWIDPVSPAALRRMFTPDP